MVEGGGESEREREILETGTSQPPQFTIRAGDTRTIYTNNNSNSNDDDDDNNNSETAAGTREG